MAINILNSEIFNRISAGEVVERPASIVKELVENSLDAGAKSIKVEIANGGIDLIRVTDDGCGIEFEDIKKAFLPHATSKIKTIDDLNNIFTLGFRGEALPSIVSVTQTSLFTKTKDSEFGYSVDVYGGNFGEIKRTAGQTGTTFEVKNLFFNTPARRKFLKRPKQEESEITNLMTRFILANPNISIKYLVDNKVYFNHNAGDLLSAIYCVYDENTTPNVLPIDIVDNNIHIYGFVSKIGFSKPNTNYQTLLVNHRYVVDETISKAVYMAYEEFLMTRQFPFYVLNVDIPFTDVDVNTHPNKLKIKFAHPSHIFDLVYNGVRRTITSSIRPVKDNQYNSITATELPKNEDEIDIESEIYDNVNQISNEITFSQSFGNNISIFDKFASNVDEPQSIQIEEKIEIPNEKSLVSSDIESSVYQPIFDFSNYKIKGEIFSEFLLLEYQDKLLFLDFHAGHERLLYDEMVKKCADKKIMIQDLLIPYTQVLTAKEIEFILDFKDDLEKIGFGIDQFSKNEIRINYVPVLCKDIDLKRFVDDLLHDFNSYKPQVAVEIDKYLMRTACRSAVKAGQTLNSLQIEALLKQLDIKNPVLLCPHGRPIVTVVTRNQLEKWFKRIV